MSHQTATMPTQAGSLAAQIASYHEILPHQIIPFFDFNDAITFFCTNCIKPRASFWSAGHSFPDLEIAMDRAGMRPKELLGASPFSGDITALANAPIQPTDVLWVSNPNRITGAHYSLSELERMAEMVPEGLLIIDEKYHAFFGINATPLLNTFDNVVLVRPIDCSVSSAGFFATRNQQIHEQLQIGERKLVTAAQQQAFHALVATMEDLPEQTELVHDESLRLALKLNRLGVRSWITATNFLLMRFPDIATAGNYLTAHNVTVENLSGYPQLSGYLRYRIQSPMINDRLLDAISRMPEPMRTNRPLSLHNHESITEAKASRTNRLAQLFTDPNLAEQVSRENVYTSESTHE
jgi:histidinol-phosphate/aromatic aminotransferase/cobyric acid decarboxylase-like protein